MERLQQLRTELELGQKQVALLEARREQVQATLLRITGAIQVLEELLGADPKLQSSSPSDEAAMDPVGAALAASR